MPELPEVETYTRYFTRHALDQKIARVDVRDERILGTLRKDAFARRLKGRSFVSARRHGKHLFADAGGVWLHLHFGMTGDLAYYREEAPRFARVVFDFDNGAHLAFEDMRLFGLVDLVDDPDAFIEESGLGPDPLTLRFAGFASLLERRRGAIKSLLMAQEIIAGLGNLYVDETLYQASIHPRRPVDSLSSKETRALYDTMRRILREAITRHARGADLPGNALYHHREEGERCPRCGGTIQRAVVFGRTTYFCGRHQR
ncbi:MAG TPA: DNA-formamidopyrimidine glycosylase family protein [Thermoanaerobaculia bacterium]|nr:DNA-formamidopyrimidine glycosylase family protein [Thermoanaerobaculia bacterium]